jgi:hypothetical protein
MISGLRRKKAVSSFTLWCAWFVLDTKAFSKGLFSGYFFSGHRQTDSLDDVSSKGFFFRLALLPFHDSMGPGSRWRAGPCSFLVEL